MGGGNRHVILNTNERIVSPDHNRHQQIGARERCEHMRYLANVAPGAWELGLPFGSTSAPSTVTNPLRADVFEGLTVLPQAGTTSVFIVAGVVGLLDPDGQAGSSDPNPPSADDSPYKIVRDAGVSVIGSLLIAANAGPGIRIDVVECQRKETVVDSANRDIFDPALGTYSSVLVDKASEGQLEYRVRQGVAGAGFPGTALGWLPLAVASSPAGSASVDDVTFWDVRPLVSDRVMPPSSAYHLLAPPFDYCNLYCERATAPAELRCGGSFVGEIRGYRSGGRLRKGTPSAVMGAGDLDYVDAENAENQDPAFAPAGTDLWYLWLCCPFDLPRWVRYEETAIGQRLPWGSRGIPVVSSVGPTWNSMAASGNVFLPLSTGLDPASVSPVTWLQCVATGVCLGGVPQGFLADGDWHHLRASPAVAAPGVGGSLSYDEYTLTPGVDFPANAKVVKVEVRATVTTGAVFDVYLALRKMHNATATVASEVWAHRGTLTPNGGGTIDASYTVDVPRIPKESVPGITDPLVFRFYWNIGAGPNKAAESCTVLGWRLDG